MPCLAPSRRALVCLLIVIVVQVGKSFLTRSAILSTQAVTTSGEHLHISTTGVAFSALSCAATVLCAILIFIWEPSSLQTPDAKTAPALVVITLFSTIDLGCTNAAIARLPAPVQQVLAALNPLFTIVLESVLACQLKHPFLYVTVSSLVVGASLVAYGQMSLSRRASDGQFVHTDEAWGVLLALFAVLSSAIKYVLLRRVSVRMKDKVGAVAFVFWVDMIAFLLLSIVALASSEFSTFVDSLLAAANPTAASIVVFVTACLGGLRFFTEVFALRIVAAIDLSAAKSLANCLYIVLAVALPAHVVNANAPQFSDRPHGNATGHDASSNSPDATLFSIGLALVFASLAAYWLLQRRLGPEGLVVHTCAPTDGACTSCVDFMGEADGPHNASGIASRDDGPAAEPLPLDCGLSGAGRKVDPNRPATAA